MHNRKETQRNAYQPHCNKSTRHVTNRKQQQTVCAAGCAKNSNHTQIKFANILLSSKPSRGRAPATSSSSFYTLNRKAATRDCCCFYSLCVVVCVCVRGWNVDSQHASVFLLLFSSLHFFLSARQTVLRKKKINKNKKMR